MTTPKKKDDLTPSERTEQDTFERLVSADEKQDASRAGKSEGETAPTAPPVVLGNEGYTDETARQPTPDERAAARDAAPDVEQPPTPDERAAVRDALPDEPPPPVRKR